MNSEKMIIREGNTGILYVNEKQSDAFIFYPSYDLDKSKIELDNFLNLTDHSGIKLRDSYRQNGLNWITTEYTNLFWNVFFQFVKYERFIEKYISGKKVQIEFLNDGNFKNLFNILSFGQKKSIIKNNIFNTLKNISNRRVLKKYNPRVLFYCFTPSDFRARDILIELDKSGVNYIQAVGATKKLLIDTLIKRRPYYFIDNSRTVNIFNKSYIKKSETIFELCYQSIVSELEYRISSKIEEMQNHMRLLKKSDVKILYGFDEANAIMPLLLSVKKLGIRNIAHQHGAYVKRHYGYMWNGFSRKDINWWDKIIVWGDYWKEQLLKYSTCYSDDDFIIGCNKFNMKYIEEVKLKKPIYNNLKIMIPYEFLTDTFEVGKYIKEFLRNGHSVYFKPRSDEKMEDQLAAYNLSENECSKIIMVDKIDKNIIEQIDVVAGTMTTLIYELMPYNKIIWYLDTDYKHLYDLVEQGYAHHIRLDEIKNISAAKMTPTIIQTNYFFNNMPLNEVIQKNIG